MLKKIRHIHFVGIGGIGMSGIAEVLMNLGYAISGSDMKSSEITNQLISKGAKITIGHDAKNVTGANVVVYSNAVSSENPEIRKAKESKIPVIPRAEMLAELMRLKYGIAIAGTHGKTTTTSMAAIVLTYAGLDPTIVIGGRLRAFGINAKLGKGEFLVAEADESDGSFLSLSPIIAVATNIDNDHLDHYGTMEKVKIAFIEFLNKVPFYGSSIICADDPNLLSIKSKLIKKVITYGIENGTNVDIKAKEIKLSDTGSKFLVEAFGKEIGEITLPSLGKHNILNSLAVISVALELEVNFEKIKSALSSFTGVGRRLETIGEVIKL